MQKMQIYDGYTVPVRDGFLIWPKRWSLSEEHAALQAWEGPRPDRKDFVDEAAYARTFELWARFAGLVTPRQRLLIDAWTNRNNINKALAWISPLTFRDFGFETACQVHGNGAKRPCGCHFHYVVDHHKTRAGRATDFDQQPFRVVEVCAVHRHLNSVAALFWTSAHDSGPNADEWKPRGHVVTCAAEHLRLVKLRELQAA